MVYLLNVDLTCCRPAPYQPPILSWETSCPQIDFVDRDRTDLGVWVESRPESVDCYHLFIVTKECFLEVFYHGALRYSGKCCTGMIIFSRPDQQVLFSGIGPARFLQIRSAQEFPPPQIATPILRALRCDDLHAQSFSVDVGLGVLARMHAFASDLGISPGSPYLSALREGMLNRVMVLRSLNATIRKDHSEMLVQAKARRVIEHIEMNLRERLTLSQLSEVAGFSRAHFARAFRNSIGMSPHQFVRHRRLTKAMCLVRARKLTLAEISHSCGFADQAHLTRTFKFQYGSIPTSFGKRLT